MIIKNSSEGTFHFWNQRTGCVLDVKPGSNDVEDMLYYAFSKEIIANPDLSVPSLEDGLDSIPVPEGNVEGSGSDFPVLTDENSGSTEESEEDKKPESKTKKK